MGQPIHIRFTRFSAFYSPLIATIAGGFLEEEGFAPTHSVCGPGESPQASLVDGSVQVAQWAPAQALAPLEAGRQPPVVHFAQINERDGFFLVGRRPEPQFSWERLRSRRILVDHGTQPLAMFRYACRTQGIDAGTLNLVDTGATPMERAFRDGVGDYVHLQGPAPQQLVQDGVGHIVAAVGSTFGPVAFSSIAATREWLRGDDARRFMRSYRRARDWTIRSSPSEIAAAEQRFFPSTAPAALTGAIASYQALGCWTPHVEVTRAAFELLLEVYLHAGHITRRHRYEDAIWTAPL
jgi:NitT/TauT family transport system substrate-binding protein